jgi:hypothetical protein
MKFHIVFLVTFCSFAGNRMIHGWLIYETKVSSSIVHLVPFTLYTYTLLLLIMFFNVIKNRFLFQEREEHTIQPEFVSCLLRIYNIKLHI